MSTVDKWFSSPENQKRYGFTYNKEPDGPSSIYYDGDDGDFNALLDIAYKELGFVEVKMEQESSDPRPVLELEMTEKGDVRLKDSDEKVEFGVDGEGSEPNFYIRFSYQKEEVIVRFSLVDPKICPDNESCPYRFTNQSLTVINQLFQRNCEQFYLTWNLLRPDLLLTEISFPNFRAINRIR